MPTRPTRAARIRLDPPLKILRGEDPSCKEVEAALAAFRRDCLLSWSRTIRASDCAAQPSRVFGSQSLVRLPHAGQGDRRGIRGASYGNGPLTVPLPDVGAEGDTTARKRATHASEKAKQMGRPGIA
jgi:hypothetical protein